MRRALFGVGPQGRVSSAVCSQISLFPTRTCALLLSSDHGNLSLHVLFHSAAISQRMDSHQCDVRVCLEGVYAFT